MTQDEVESGFILIVEDDEALGSLLLEEVRDSGFEAEWVAAAEQAEKLMERRWPDLVVCDLRLPGMDGLSFMAKLREKAADSSPGFLVITAFGTIPKAVEALKAGAEAQEGTILLDEISEMPLSLQAKLLRVLQDGKLRRLGDNKEFQADVRVLAATHRDLEEEVRLGHFREDLFYRLETFTLQVPPLRERGEDIELLAARFLREFTLTFEKRIKGFSSEALTRICEYPFPGNVRELKNVVERAVTFASGGLIRIEHLPVRIRNFRPENDSCPSDIYGTSERKEKLLPLAEIERRYINHVLKRVGGNKRKAAGILGIGRRTLYRRLGGEDDSE
ncbi:MAG TPA: sigma-54-dependent Fis family transcriptional regulator [Desulfobacteraceae bacterium]|nr:sigma-54-dependent Fis family transcriptional regulator [Desulfobacteraceae bacterium]